MPAEYAAMPTWDHSIVDESSEADVMDEPLLSLSLGEENLFGEISVIDGVLEHAYQASREKWRYFLIFASLGVANLGDMMEAVCMGYVLANDGFQTQMIGNGEKWYGALAASSVVAGMVMGGMLAGAVEACYNRKSTVLVGLTNNAVMNLVSAFAPNIYWFVLARFGCGIGMGAINTILMALAAELSPPSQRGLLLSFTSGCAMAGSVVAAILGWLCFSIFRCGWRLFLILVGIPTMLAVILVACLVPDSPRTLALHGNYRRAALALSRLCQSLQYRDSQLRVVAIQAEYKDKAHKVGLWGALQSLWENVKSLYQESALCRSTIALQCMYLAMSCGLGVGVWMNTMLKDLQATNVYLTTFLMALASVPGTVMCAFLVDRVGRKPLLVGTLVWAASSLLGLSFLVKTKVNTAHHPYLLVLLTCSYNAAFYAAWNVTYVMTAEAFPTNVRGIGNGICSATGKVALAVAVFIYGSLASRPSVLFSTASTFLFLGALFAAFIPLRDMARQPLTDLTATAANR